MNFRACSFIDKALCLLSSWGFKVLKLEDKNIVIPVKLESIPIAQKGGFKVTLQPGETQVLLLNDLEIK